MKIILIIIFLISITALVIACLAFSKTRERFNTNKDKPSITSNTTLLTNVYNEEYLLPFWLHHHKDMFDNIVIIDFRSTDKSMEICKRIVPNCKIITTKNKYFDAENIDKEFMDYFLIQLLHFLIV